MLSHFWPLLVLALLGGGGVAGLWFVLLSGMVRYIPNHRVGVVEKLMGGKALSSGFVALHKETGFQPDVLRGGWHFFAPFVYRIHKVPLVTIPQGQIGYVFARDGRPLDANQALAAHVDGTDVQDVRGFLEQGGQRGPQRRVLREGTYAVNLAQFAVLTQDQLYFLPLERGDDVVFQRMAKQIAERDGFRPVVIKGQDDVLGVVTVHDGPSLGDGEIIAPTVGGDGCDPSTWHDNFQSPEAFLRAGGRRGRQLQVLVEGTYYVNRLFATVEFIPKTVIEVGYVGVVVSYTGQKGQDQSGATYAHGETVQNGQRGVWSTPLLPGKYAFNTYAGKVIPVPTTNVILKWISHQTGAHRFDENLAEVSLITKDAFEPHLPLSVVVHIDYRKAPLVIQRFGDIKKLVEQTLDPMVSAYFKNVAQTRTLIQLLQDRAAIQAQASEQMKEKFAHYNLELEEVLIGTPTSDGNEIDTILTQLRARQIAEEQIETYQVQERASVKERELREAEAKAKQQPKLTESEMSIAIATNQGKAEYQRSVQEAARIRALAEAEAEKAARVGIAQALAAEEQVRAYGGPQYQVASQAIERFAKAIETARIDMVPKVVVGGSSGKDGQPMGGNLMEALLAVLLSEKMGVAATLPERRPEAEAIRKSLSATLHSGPAGQAK